MLTDNDLLAQHGPTGGLITRLQRYSLAGWALAITFIALFVGYVFVDKLMPVPVLAVNEEGQILGHFEYLSPASRTDDEYVAGAIRFLRSYMSANSAFVFEDYTEALNMMAPDLRQEKIDKVVKTGYLARIADANTVSRLELDRDIPPALIARRDLDGTVRVRGRVVARAGDAMSVERPFDVTVTLRAIPRTSLATYGFLVIDTKDN